MYHSEITKQQWLQMMQRKAKLSKEDYISFLENLLSIEWRLCEGLVQNKGKFHILAEWQQEEKCLGCIEESNKDLSDIAKILNN